MKASTYKLPLKYISRACKMFPAGLVPAQKLSCSLL